MRSDIEALQGIRDWAAKGEARGMGGRLGLELPEDADFVALSEETPGVEPEESLEVSGDAPGEGDEVSPEQLEEILALLTASGG